VSLTGLTGEEHRFDRCVTTQFGIFEAEDTRSLKISKTALEGLVPLVISKGYFRLSVSSI
jgi:hypothetical protein